MNSVHRDISSKTTSNVHTNPVFLVYFEGLKGRSKPSKLSAVCYLLGKMMESMADNSNRKDQLIRQHTIKVDRQQNHEEMDKD